MEMQALQDIIAMLGASSRSGTRTCRYVCWGLNTNCKRNITFAETCFGDENLVLLESLDQCSMTCA